MEGDTTEPAGLNAGPDFADLEAMRSLYITGRTDAGVPIVVFIPKNLQVDTDAQRERALTYFLRTMDAVCSAPYVLIYCHATMSWFSRTHFSWLREAHRRLPHRFRKNLQALYVLHPTSMLRAFFLFARPFIKTKFWRKLHFAWSVPQLRSALAPAHVDLPRFVLKYDAANTPQSSDGTGLVFGAPLEWQLTRGAVGDTAVGGVPDVVVACVRYLDRHALQTEGLFRVPGSAKDALKAEANTRLRVHLYRSTSDGSLAPKYDATTVASLLKAYLRELPDPVLPASSYEALLRCVTDATAAAAASSNAPADVADIGSADAPPAVLACVAERLRPMMSSLPERNQQTLAYLCKLLNRVLAHAADNRMSAKNLAIVNSPNLLRPGSQNPLTMMRDMPYALLLTQALVVHPDYVFQDALSRARAACARRRASCASEMAEDKEAEEDGKACSDDAFVAATAAPETSDAHSDAAEAPLDSAAPRHLAVPRVTVDCADDWEASLDRDDAPDLMWGPRWRAGVADGVADLGELGECTWFEPYPRWHPPKPRPGEQQVVAGGAAGATGAAGETGGAGEAGAAEEESGLAARADAVEETRSAPARAAIGGGRYAALAQAAALTPSAAGAEPSDS